jgi:hypothetical protein
VCPFLPPPLHDCPLRTTKEECNACCCLFSWIVLTSPVLWSQKAKPALPFWHPAGVVEGEQLPPFFPPKVPDQSLPVLDSVPLAPSSSQHSGCSVLWGQFGVLAVGTLLLDAPPDLVHCEAQVLPRPAPGGLTFFQEGWPGSIWGP